MLLVSWIHLSQCDDRREPFDVCSRIHACHTKGFPSNSVLEVARVCNETSLLSNLEHRYLRILENATRPALSENQSWPHCRTGFPCAMQLMRVSTISYSTLVTMIVSSASEPMNTARTFSILSVKLASSILLTLQDHRASSSKTSNRWLVIFLRKGSSIYRTCRISLE